MANHLHPIPPATTSKSPNWTDQETRRLIEWAGQQPGIKTQVNFKAVQLKSAADYVSATEGSAGWTPEQVKTRWGAVCSMVTFLRPILLIFQTLIVI